MTQIRFDAGGEPVTLIGAGPVPHGFLGTALTLAPTVIAADGGADHALPAGHRYAAVIGDMDSQRGAARLADEGTALHPISEQNSTDLEKCLYSVSAPLYLGLGFLGGRIDHHMAAMNALARYPDRRVVLIGQEDVCFLCPMDFALDMPAGTRVSLFPMAPVTGTVSEGLRWPIDGLAFRPGGRIGTSNAALGGIMRVRFDAAAMLMILPSSLLQPVAAEISRSR